jgi:sugar transferase (PEP-CTERM/EpsH1 system associated)
MNILVISNALPFPPHDGSRLILFNLLKQLSSRHNIDLIAFLDDPSSAKYKEKIAPYCNNLSTVLTKQSYSVFNKVLYHLSLTPYIVTKRYSQRMAEQVKNEISQRKYELIHFDGFTMLPYGLGVRSIPKIAYVVDAVSLYFQRNFDRESHFTKKISYIVEFLRMRRYEQKIYRQFDRCIVVSETDKAALQKSCPDARFDVIPNGVDTSYFKPEEKEKFPTLLFSGNMDYPPNVQAVVWFVRNVLPKIINVFPDVKLYVVGRNPSSELDFLKDDVRITVTGFVHDIRPFLDQASVYICPMLSGTGIKNKLLEAMAMGKAIAASPLSLEGVPGVRENGCLLVADTGREFSDVTIELLQNSGLRSKLGQKARKFVIENYSWKASANQLERIYAEAISGYGK